MRAVNTPLPKDVNFNKITILKAFASNKNLKFLLPLFITFVILFLIFSKIDYGEIEKVLGKSDKSLILLAVTVFFLNLLVPAARWKSIMKLMGYNIEYKTVLKSYLANMPLAKISPLNSGDVVRAFYLKSDMPVDKNISVVFLENCVDILALALLAMTSGLLLKIKMTIIAGGVISLSVFLLMFFLPFLAKKLPLKNEKWKNRLTDLTSALTLLKKPYPVFLIGFYTFLLWFIALVCFEIIFHAYGANISFAEVLARQPVAIFLGLLPITISGVGIRESSMLFLYHDFLAAPIILATGLTYSFLAAVVLPLLCLPLLFSTIIKLKRKQKI